MAKDDYHVIVYQILSYLYIQLKKGLPVDEEILTAEALFNINEEYRKYIFENLSDEGYIKGIEVKHSKYIDGSINVEVECIEDCQITPKGIEYLTDNSFMLNSKAKLAGELTKEKTRSACIRN